MGFDQKTMNKKSSTLGVKTKVTINGERGSLEGIYAVGSDDLSAPIILLLHPQPNSKGTMYNEVLQEVLNFMLSLGFNVLTINFGGVGASAGKIENGFGEFLDAASAFKWLSEQHPYSKFRWVFGFSFGAYIAAQLTMRRPEIDNFIYLSAPIGVYDMTFFSPCPVPGLFIHSKNDKIVTEDKLLSFFVKNDKCKNITYHRVESENPISHFFKNIDYKTILLSAIYKYVKINCNWDNLVVNPEHEALLNKINYLQYDDFVNILAQYMIENEQLLTIEEGELGLDYGEEMLRKHMQMRDIICEGA